MEQSTRPTLTQQAIEQMMKVASETPVEPEVQQPQKSIDWPAWATLIGGNAADVGSTIYGLNNGMRETNPLVGSHPSASKLIGAKAGSVALQALIMKLLERSGHDKAAEIIGYGSGGVGGAIAANNIRLTKKRQD